MSKDALTTKMQDTCSNCNFGLAVFNMFGKLKIRQQCRLPWNKGTYDDCGKSGCKDFSPIIVTVCYNGKINMYDVSTGEHFNV